MVMPTAKNGTERILVIHSSDSGPLMTDHLKAEGSCLATQDLVKHTKIVN